MIKRGGILIERNKEFKYSALSFWDAFEENNNLIVSNVSFNGIFKIDMSNYKSEFIMRFDKEFGIRGLHKQVISYKDILIFIPELAENVAFLDKNTLRLEYTSIVLKDTIAGETKVAAAFVYKDELWLFPQYISQDIIIINLQTKTTKCNNLLKKIIRDNEIPVGYPMFATPILQENEVWIPIKNTSYIIKIDFDTFETRIYSLLHSDFKINSIDFFEKKFWITSTNSLNIMKWNPYNGEEHVYYIDVEWDGKSTPFSRIIPISEEQCMILPAHTDSFLLKEDCIIKSIQYPRGFHWVDDFKVNWTRCYSFKKKDKKIIILPSSGNMLLIYDTANQSMEGTVCRVPADWDDKYVIRNHIFPFYMKKQLMDKNVIYETEINSLENFIYCLKSQFTCIEKDTNKRNGKKIYEWFKDG